MVLDSNKSARYPKAIHSGGRIFHYGHVRPAEVMQKKIDQTTKYWNHPPPDFSKYRIDPQAIQKYQGTHPAVLKGWISSYAQKHFQPDYSHVPTKREIRHRLTMKLEKIIGMQIGKKHYKLM